MHSFAQHHRRESREASSPKTKGRVLDLGWRYDLFEWFFDNLLFHGKLRELRQRTINLARIQPGEKVLDVGCGTGTLAIKFSHTLAQPDASAVLIRARSRSPVPARKLRGATCPSNSRSA